MNSAKNPARVRFAPAPTGMMHLGNVRTALVNFLFARQHQGSFVLRLEDTDAQRLFDPSGSMIMADLAWLGLSYDEGPTIGGPYGPYMQSQRTSIYATHLEQLIAQKSVYRCFCTAEELEKKRSRQIELKKAPRYDRTCAKLSEEEIARRCAERMPFIWRFYLAPETVTISDLARGSVSFDLSNFSDFPLTRQDGSFTFIFANCVDDITMQITHVFRGEDHLSNTANQIMIYRAFNAPVPIFWHTAIIINQEGKKLSKRDFGFSLNDLRAAGFLPQAILNYLAIVGSKTPEQEIMDTEALIAQINIEQTASANAIRYDSEKLRWINHMWIKQSNSEYIAAQCRPFLEAAYPHAASLSPHELNRIIAPLYQEFTTLADAVPVLYGYFVTPELDLAALQQHDIHNFPTVLQDIVTFLQHEPDSTIIVDQMKAICRAANQPIKQLWALVRIALTGRAEGISISHLFAILPPATVRERLRKLVTISQAL